MFRVYDFKKRKWITEDVYLAPDGNLYLFEKALLGAKLKLLDENYIYHDYIGMNDKNNICIYTDDILKVEAPNGEVVIGQVVFAPELASYVLLVHKTKTWFSVGSDISDIATIIGNVIDNPELLEYRYEEEESDQQSLQEV